METTKKGKQKHKNACARISRAFLALLLTAAMLAGTASIQAYAAPAAAKKTTAAAKTAKAAKARHPQIKDIFDAKYYADQNPDLKAVFGYDEKLLYSHFIRHGIKEGRVVSPLFDLQTYRAGNPDLNAKYGDNWSAYVQHFVRYGLQETAEGRRASTGVYFNPNAYKEAYPDVAAIVGTNWIQLTQHFLKHGINEGRTEGVTTPSIVAASKEAEKKAEEAKKEEAKKTEAPAPAASESEKAPAKPAHKHTANPAIHTLAYFVENDDGEMVCKIEGCGLTLSDFQDQHLHTWNAKNGKECSICGKTCEHNFTSVDMDDPEVCTSCNTTLADFQNKCMKKSEHTKIDVDDECTVCGKKGTKAKHTSTSVHTIYDFNTVSIEGKCEVTTCTLTLTAWRKNHGPHTFDKDVGNGKCTVCYMIDACSNSKNHAVLLKGTNCTTCGYLGDHTHSWKMNLTYSTAIACDAKGCAVTHKHSWKEGKCVSTDEKGCTALINKDECKKTHQAGNTCSICGYDTPHAIDINNHKREMFGDNDSCKYCSTTKEQFQSAHAGSHHFYIQSCIDCDKKLEEYHKNHADATWTSENGKHICSRALDCNALHIVDTGNKTCTVCKQSIEQDINVAGHVHRFSNIGDLSLSKTCEQRDGKGCTLTLQIYRTIHTHTAWKEMTNGWHYCEGCGTPHVAEWNGDVDGKCVYEVTVKKWGSNVEETVSCAIICKNATKHKTQPKETMCLTCGYIKPHDSEVVVKKHIKDWFDKDGNCKYCEGDKVTKEQFQAEHGKHTFEYLAGILVCSKCDITQSKYHSDNQHNDWDNEKEKNHICNVEDCKFYESHNYDSDGVCTVCGYVCSHGIYKSSTGGPISIGDGNSICDKCSMTLTNIHKKHADTAKWGLNPRIPDKHACGTCDLTHNPMWDKDTGKCKTEVEGKVCDMSCPNSANHGKDKACETCQYKQNDDTSTPDPNSCEHEWANYSEDEQPCAKNCGTKHTHTWSNGQCTATDECDMKLTNSFDCPNSNTTHATMKIDKTCEKCTYAGTEKYALTDCPAAAQHVSVQSGETCDKCPYHNLAAGSHTLANFAAGDECSSCSVTKTEFQNAHSHEQYAAKDDDTQHQCIVCNKAEECDWGSWSGGSRSCTKNCGNQDKCQHNWKVDTLDTATHSCTKNCAIASHKEEIPNGAEKCMGANGICTIKIANPNEDGDSNLDTPPQPSIGGPGADEFFPYDTNNTQSQQLESGQTDLINQQDSGNETVPVETETENPETPADPASESDGENAADTDAQAKEPAASVTNSRGFASLSSMMRTDGNTSAFARYANMLKAVRSQYNATLQRISDTLKQVDITIRTKAERTLFAVKHMRMAALNWTDCLK